MSAGARLEIIGVDLASGPDITRYPIVGDKFWGNAVVVKRNKRLHIEVLETGQHLYTPPDFVRLNSREPLQALAGEMTKMGKRDIALIAAFEGEQKRRRRG